jgi:hypothetical protein
MGKVSRIMKNFLGKNHDKIVRNRQKLLRLRNKPMKYVFLSTKEKKKLE